MIKYFRKAGYKEAKNKNDLVNLEFFLENISFIKSEERSTFSDIKMDRVETYILFLKTFDGSAFNAKLESIINNALQDGIKIYNEITAEAERQENGYLITISIIIKG